MENVVNPTNVGAIFRSAAAALYMDGILLTPGLQQSIIPQGGKSQYGDGIPGSLDLSG